MTSLFDVSRYCLRPR